MVLLPRVFVTGVDGTTVSSTSLGQRVVPVASSVGTDPEVVILNLLQGLEVWRHLAMKKVAAMLSEYVEAKVLEILLSAGNRVEMKLVAGEFVGS